MELLNASKVTKVRKTAVLVNLYELNTAFSGTKKLGIPLLHSATEIFGYEIAFGGTKDLGTGIFLANPLSMPKPAKFYK